jgi:superfamily I DNA and RNA helicase
VSLLWRRRRDLHPDQIKAIEGLLVTGRYLLLGPPGSGKTSILLHRGQYLRLAPHNLANVRLLTFSRTLREFIAVSGDDRFPPTLIQTVRDFVDQLFRTYGVARPTFDEKVDLPEQNRIRALEALRLVEQDLRVQYDALLVDEVQDLCPEEVELVSKLSERLMISGDSRQRLFEPVGGIDAAREHGCTDTVLRHHFRISPQICRVADCILVQGNYRLAEYCHYQGPAPTEPVALGNLSREEQIAKLFQALDVQFDTYNTPGDLIGVVAWRKDDCDFISAKLRLSERFSRATRVFHSAVPGRRFDSDCRICVVTAQGCKGIEFRALHWLFADEPSYMTRERAYTVVTRAKTSLTVYHEGPLHGSLAGAFPPPGRGLFEEDDR